MATSGQRSGDDGDLLLVRLRRGDPDAFDSLIRLQGGRLLAVARRILRNEEDARDAVQEAFLAAFRSLDDFEGGARLSTWLHRIAVNACLMKLRSQRRKPEESIEPLLPRFLDDGHATVQTREWPETADRILEREEDRVYIRECIDRLPEGYRTVLILRDIEELDTGEAARAMALTPTAVKVRLHRARQALRGLLAPRFEGNLLRPAASNETARENGRGKA